MGRVRKRGDGIRGNKRVGNETGGVRGEEEVQRVPLHVIPNSGANTGTASTEIAGVSLSCGAMEACLAVHVAAFSTFCISSFSLSLLSLFYPYFYLYFASICKFW